MRKSAFLLFPLLALMCSCNQNSGSGNQSHFVKTFNVLENYNYLTIYKADGSILEQWISGDSGSVDHLLKYYSELKLDLYVDYYQILGNYTYNNVTKSVDIVYSINVAFRLGTSNIY